MSWKLYIVAFVFAGLSDPAWALDENTETTTIASAEFDELAVELGHMAADLRPGPSRFSLTWLVVDSKWPRVIVKYDETTPEGRMQEGKLAQFSLAGDREVNYKMGMLMLLRQALEDSELPILISLDSSTLGQSIPTVSAVGVVRRP